MVRRKKLTLSTDEKSISAVISGDTVFSIPYFQRAYKWNAAKLKQLNRDILNIIDSSDNHFLGAIIVHGRPSGPADPNIYEIIDGQQRLTTLFLYLCAVVRFLCQKKEYRSAKKLFQNYLILTRDTDEPSNIKLRPCKEDRAQFNYVFNDLLSDSTFKKDVGEASIKILPSAGSDKGKLRNNYKAAQRFLHEQYQSSGSKRIQDIYTAILDSISVVQIDVLDPTNGPKIFNGLNSQQQPMTIGDLVRNEVFSRISNEDPAVIENMDEHDWQPFYNKFKQGNKNLFDEFFFPYGLVQNPNLVKSEVYSSLRDDWQSKNDPEEIIGALSVYQNAFIDIVSGSNQQRHGKRISEAFGRLTASKLPSSTYPFLMQLSNAIADKTVTEKDGLDILVVIESFLVRRAIVGQEPTGLHAVFKRLWKDCSGKPTKAIVIEAIKRHTTVSWPTDKEFSEAIMSRPLYGVGITSWVLIEYDYSLKGDKPDQAPWIEHVLPRIMSGPWKADFTADQHGQLLHCLANLIPLSAEMNNSVGNKGYAAKRERYRTDSMFKTARTFAEEFNTWTPEDLSKRAKKLARWAVKRWSS
jgi:uncharacterized protein with ParB-like and HNH nuclease domain